ncbi:hypothetical protein, partial [Variovorax sp. SCN 67-20]|uniref:hypothetical protein n=1 Tax=Variovorax sp. SCN 67-20 TaxID=1660153 RepID=UPI0025E9AB7C
MAIVITGALATIGLAMAAGGRNDLMGSHGWIVLLLAGAVLIALMRGYDGPDPDPERLSRYYDDPTKVGVFLTLTWGVVGMAFG